MVESAKKRMEQLDRHHADRIMTIQQEYEDQVTLLEQDVLPPEGTPITIRGFASKHGANPSTVLNWVEYGWVPILKRGKGPGSPTYIDEREALRVLLHHPGTRGPDAKTKTE